MTRLYITLDQFNIPNIQAQSRKNLLKHLSSLPSSQKGLMQYDNHNHEQDYNYEQEEMAQIIKLNSDKESIKEPGSNSPLHDEFVKEIYNTKEDYS